MGKISKITDEMLAEAVLNSSSYQGVLKYLGLKLAGGSLSHYKRRINMLNLDISHFTGQGWSKGKTLPKKEIRKMS